MIGIIGAMPEEIQELLADVRERQEEQLGPFLLHRGLLESQSVVVAQCGIGKVNAAALTQSLIHLGATSIIFTGVAGGLEPGLRVGDIVVSSDCLQHDVDVSALDYSVGQIPGESFSWQADTVLHRLALQAAQQLKGVRSVAGRILSGDQFLNSTEQMSELRETFAAACVEMEGAAVAQVCSKWQIPFVIIRSISDAGDEASAVDFRSFMPLAAKHARLVVRGVLQATYAEPDKLLKDLKSTAPLPARPARDK